MMPPLQIMEQSYPIVSERNTNNPKLGSMEVAHVDLHILISILLDQWVARFGRVGRS